MTNSTTWQNICISKYAGDYQAFDETEKERVKKPSSRLKSKGGDAGQRTEDNGKKKKSTMDFNFKVQKKRRKETKLKTISVKILITLAMVLSLTSPATALIINTTLEGGISGFQMEGDSLLWADLPNTNGKNYNQTISWAEENGLRLATVAEVQALFQDIMFDNDFSQSEKNIIGASTYVYAGGVMAQGWAEGQSMAQIWKYGSTQSKFLRVSASNAVGGWLVMEEPDNNAAPEPSTLALMAAGMIGLVAARRKRLKK